MKFGEVIMKGMNVQNGSLVRPVKKLRFSHINCPISNITGNFRPHLFQKFCNVILECLGLLQRGEMSTLVRLIRMSCRGMSEGTIRFFMALPFYDLPSVLGFLLSPPNTEAAELAPWEKMRSQTAF